MWVPPTLCTHLLPTPCHQPQLKHDLHFVCSKTTGQPPPPQVALDSDVGAPHQFATASWILRQAFSVVDPGPAQAPTSAARHYFECIQVSL